MRRSIVKCLAVAAAVTLGATACGSGETSTSEESSASEGTSASSGGDAAVSGTLRVLAPSYPASTEGKAAFQAVVDAFQEAYPDVEVEPDFATFDTLNEKISTSIAGGTPYDIIISGIGWVPPFASKGAYLDLAQFGVTPESLAETTVEAMIPSGVYDGAVYGIPLIAGSKPLALRRSLFEAAGLDPDSPPQTLDAIREAAVQLTVKDSAGTVTQAGFDFWAGTGGYRQDFVALLGALGSPLYDADSQPGFDNAAGERALQWITDMINEDGVIAYAQQSASQAPMVTTGEAAMGFTGGYIDCSEDGVGQEVCDDLSTSTWTRSSRRCSPEASLRRSAPRPSSPTRPGPSSNSSRPRRRRLRSRR